MKLITALVFISSVLGAVTCRAQEVFDSAGTEIHYTVSGKGPAVVLIHGFIGSSQDWTAPPPFLPPDQQARFKTVFETLSRHYRVIAADCRGHGLSGKPMAIEQYGLEMVADVIRLLDHLEVEKAHVIGYSMGAFLAAKLVETHPDRVMSVILGGGGALLDGSEQLAFMESLGRSLQAGKGVEPLVLALMPPGAPGPTPEQIAQGNQMFLAGQDEHALSMVALGHAQLTVSVENLKASQVPSLLIVGRNDPLKVSSEETARLMPHSQLVVLDGMDHVSTLMSPDYVKNMENFLAGQSTGE